MPRVFPLMLNNQEFMTAWALWEQHRKEIKKKLTPTQIDQQLKKCEQLGSRRAIAMIHHTIEKGWVGLREPEGLNGKPPPPPRKEPELGKAVNW